MEFEGIFMERRCISELHKGHFLYLKQKFIADYFFSIYSVKDNCNPEMKKVILKN